LKPAYISEQSPQALIDYAIAQGSAWRAFCKEAK
jgi:hypothetical protein